METTSPTPDGSTLPAEPLNWSWRTKCIVSALLLWHVSAIFVGPASVDPTSGLMLSMFRVYRPYLDALYLNHGYRFFAPEPGPSHLVRYEMVMPDGSKKSGFFPDKQNQWPRLRYHRHFMLSEHLAQFTEERTPPELLHTFSKSYAQHLLAEHHGREVKLILVRHLFPSPDQVLEGMKLTDKRLYFERVLGVFRADETEEPDEPEELPIPSQA